MPGRTGQELQQAKAKAAERFQEIALLILQDAGVNTWTYHQKGLRGRAWPKKRHVVCPKPTTRRRLYILAHECAHVALHHIRSKPSHRQEFEAELYAHQALMRYDIAVPQQETDRARGYVAYRIDQAIRMGRAKRLDREAVEWSRGKHGAATRRALREGTVNLVDLGGRKRVQRSLPPKAKRLKQHRTVAEQVQAAAEASGLGVNQITHRTGLDQSALNRFMNGTRENIRAYPRTF